ncbi:MAG: hypothetical protein H0X39_05185 [Actinobacteria bacterium]|nr:hypothetical protein [Actinomycetota bacterium]
MDSGSLGTAQLRALYTINDNKRELQARFLDGMTPVASDYHALIDWACAASSAIGVDAEISGDDLPRGGLFVSRGGTLRVACGKGVALDPAGVGVEAVAPLFAHDLGLTLMAKLMRSGLHIGDAGVALVCGAAMTLAGGALGVATGDGLRISAGKVEIALAKEGPLSFIAGAVAIGTEALQRARTYDAGKLLNEINAETSNARQQLYELLKDH